MDKKVILIYAPQDIGPGLLHRPPLGVIYLATLLKKKGFLVEIFDFQRARPTWSDLEQTISNSQYCLIGFSCDSDNIHRSVRLSNRVLNKFDHVKIVFGGPHLSHIFTPYVDKRSFVIRGEGEYPLLLLANYVLHGAGSLECIPGLAYLKRGKISSNDVDFGPYDDLNNIPTPDYSLLPDISSYQPALITARGCCFRCHFCSEGRAESGWRPNSIAKIEQELIALKQQYNNKLSYLYIADDTFIVNRQRVNQICDLFDKHFPDKSKFGFFCEGRVNILAKSPELIDRLLSAGARRIQIGIETGQQHLIDRLNKKITSRQIERVVAALHNAGISSIVAPFMCGIPWQTEQDVRQDIQFARHLVDLAPGSLEVSMVAMTPLPGTEYRENSSRWKITLVDPDFTLGTIQHNTAFSYTETLSKPQIEDLCNLFNSELLAYTLQKASLVPKHRWKQLIIQNACLGARTLVLNILCSFEHINTIAHLRKRSDFSFLFEIPEQQIAHTSPLRMKGNTVRQDGDTTVINPGSPMAFTLTRRQYRYYQYFSGKHSFGEIPAAISLEFEISADLATQELMHVYQKCEDHLATLVLL